MKQKIALIFGVTGQDGSYLAKLLISKNYQNVFKIKMPFRKTFEYIYFKNFG